jgi:hypothetical protein
MNNRDGVEAFDFKKRNRSVLMDKASEARGDDKVGKNNRYGKNIQNYTFGGKKNIKGNFIEGMIKKNLDINAGIDESLYAKEASTMKNERVGTSSFAKRL